MTVNRKVPDVTPPSPDLKFPAHPTDTEIFQARVFESPIISIGNTTSAIENADLATALLAYRNRQDPDDASAIENFLQTHPDSHRYLSLLEHLASHYRQGCQFSKALSAYQQIWALGKNLTDLDARRIVDQTVGDWASLLVTFGRMGELKSLLQQANGRDLYGAAAVRISDAGNALWQMEQQPKTTFKCGPFSLYRIRAALNLPDAWSTDINGQMSTTNGTSLYDNWALAKKMGMKYQMAKRLPGAVVPLPATVHWKLGHFSALTEYENGSYRVEDPTFSQGFVSSKVLDEESDYYLIPDGPLPAGWLPVTEKEGKTAFGKSTAKAGNPKSPTPPKPPCNGMAQYFVGLMRISLTLADTPLSYTPPRGPAVQFQVTYAERSVNQSGSSLFSNLGNQWGFEWLKYISDSTQYTNQSVDLILNNGNAETFNYISSNNTFAVEEESQGQITRTSGSSYQCLYPDGSMEIYSLPTATNGWRNVFLTKEIDPQGNALTFVYDSNFRLTNVIDAIGQVTTLSYGLSDTYKITKVTDPFGRYATFQYNSSGQLTNITDEIGVTSAFAYGAPGEADFINALTTPYGTTTFTNENADFNGRWLVATDQLGAQERYELTQAPLWLPDTDPANLLPSGMTIIDGYLSTATSFFWDKQTMAAMNGVIDYTKARQYTWDRMSGVDFDTLSSTLEAVKQPLESARVWYNYPNQPLGDVQGTINQPSAIGRVLDDGTTQLTQYQRNSIGKLTEIIDPVGRTTLYTYSTNNIDLLSAAQLAAGATNLLAQYTYNSQHLPLTSVDAAGQTSFFGYSTNGQLVAMTNALNEITLLNYDTNGYLTNIVAGTTTQLLSTNSLTYDGYGRVRTVTDPLGYTVTTSYDLADRPTNITYMDGTYQQIVYSYLDPVLQRDRDGHWTAMAYDPLRHLTDTYDNAGRHTQFSWCGCGSLDGITDPNGNVTTFVRDLENRVVTKIYPDLTQINYSYETNTSRLHSVTDAKNQSTLYSYFTDDNLKQVTYSNAVVATPSVSFTYDTNYNRIVTMVDGTGTNTYSYYSVASGQLGAGQLSSVSNSFIGPTSVIAYNYDALGRITNRAINGVSQQVAFDMLNRVSMVTNVLGGFTNTYVGGTALLSTNFYPNGQKIVLSYLGITNDERLAEVWNQNGAGGTISKFDYTYDPVGNMTNWTQQTDTNTPNVELVQYDPVNELLSATVHSNTVAGAVLKQFIYGYDLSGNRTSASMGTPSGISASSATFNNLNQMTTLTNGSGPEQFAGNLSRQGTVTIAGSAATMNHFTTNFVGYANVTNGTNVIPIIATDYGNHSRTNKYQIVITNALASQVPLYDGDGNITNDGNGISYEYDAANRTTAINRGTTNRTEFTYNGLGQRVQIVEKTNGVAYVTNKYVWEGVQLLEQRDNTGVTVVKRFFGEGEQISGTNYYFTRDHLGSVREMLDASCVLQTRYDYDPYGARNRIFGSTDADFGFTGHFTIASQPETTLTLYRLYRTDFGNWNSRDPLGETAGYNLYPYVANNPINGIDFDGLQQVQGIIGDGGAAEGDIGRTGNGQYQFGLHFGAGEGAAASITTPPAFHTPGLFFDGMATFKLPGDLSEDVSGDREGLSGDFSHPIAGPLSGSLGTEGPQASLNAGDAGFAGLGFHYYTKPHPHWKTVTYWVWQCKGSGLIINPYPGSPGPGWQLVDVEQKKVYSY